MVDIRRLGRQVERGVEFSLQSVPISLLAAGIPALAASPDISSHSSNDRRPNRHLGVLSLSDSLRRYGTIILQRAERAGLQEAICLECYCHVQTHRDSDLVRLLKE